MSEPARVAEVIELPTRRSPARAAFVSLRPRQWAKNLLLFAGILFAAKLGDPIRWLEALAAFVAYCAASSAAYLVNDVRDVSADRLHPVKRRRPIARGELRPPDALGLAAGLVALALAVAVVLGPASLACLARVRRASGRLHRAPEARRPDRRAHDRGAVRPAGGRRSDRRRRRASRPGCSSARACWRSSSRSASAAPSSSSSAPSGRRGGRRSRGIRSRSSTSCSLPWPAATIVAYALYTLTAHDSWALVATVPFVVFGLFRYLLLLHRRDLGEEPENVLLGDLPILLTVAAWAIACAAILVATLARRCYGGCGDLVAVKLHDVGDRAALDSLEPAVDALPARRDEVDEEREVVEAGVPLGDQLLLEPLEPADRVVQQPRISPRLRATGITSRRRPSCIASLTRSGKRRLEAARDRAERLDLLARAPQRSFEARLLLPALARLRDPPPGPFECLFIHGGKATLAVG